MALKYSGKLITNTEVFAMSEGITTTTYNIQKKSSLATIKNDGERQLYIVQAGTPVPSNDANCVGIVFENWDVTDAGGSIPIALSGTINEVNAAALGITYDAACKSALKNMNFMGSNMESAAVLKLSAAAGTASADYAFATGLSYTLTLSGDTFVDSVADKSLNWVVSLPSGFSVSSITKTSTTVYTIVVKAVSEAIEVPANTNVSFAILEQGVTNGQVPAAAVCNITND